MSLFNLALRLPPTDSDETIERLLAQLAAELEPDPLFRRRLRSDAVNRFVAIREGIGHPERARTRLSPMGRVGRACLYASLALGVSAASVMAASQEALPGEVLYPVKQRIEELRWNVVPAQLHAELAAYALGERIEEMGRLAAAGAEDMAVAMAPDINGEYQRLVALGQTMAPTPAVRMERHLRILQGLLQKLPATARAAVEDVIDGSTGIGQDGDLGAHAGTAVGANPDRGLGSAPGGGPDPTPRQAQRPKLHNRLTMPAIPEADATVKPEPAGARAEQNHTKPEPAGEPAPSDKSHQLDESSVPAKAAHSQRAQQSSPPPGQTSLPDSSGRAHRAGPPGQAKDQKTEENQRTE